MRVETCTSCYESKIYCTLDGQGRIKHAPEGDRKMHDSILACPSFIASIRRNLLLQSYLFEAKLAKTGRIPEEDGERR